MNQDTKESLIEYLENLIQLQKKAETSCSFSRGYACAVKDVLEEIKLYIEEVYK